MSSVAFSGEAEAPAPATAGKKTISGIHVWTDRSVDFFSRETILKSIVKPDMTDEDKAVACWRLVNRRIYHFPRADDNDPMRVLNVYGYSLCGTIQHVLVWLGQGAMGPQAAGSAGLSSQVIEDPETFKIAGGGWLLDSLVRLDGGKAPGRMGHSWCQFFYGGRHHYLDAHAGFYVYTADGKSIASIAEIGGDPTLVTDPVRTSEPFMPCDAGRPEFFYRCAGGGMGKGQEKTAHSMALTVRPGEALVLHFDKLPGGYFKRSGSWKGQWDPEFVKDGPHHRCAGGREAPWRHYGNGEILYKPDLAKAGFRETLSAGDNLAAQCDDGKPGLHPKEAGKPASATFSFATPYIMVGGEVSAEFDLPKGTSAKLVLLAGRDAKGALLAEATGEGGRARVSGKLDMQSAGYPYGAQLRIELSGGAADAPPALVALDVRIVTQLNFLTLPRLMPGKNRVDLGNAQERGKGNPEEMFIEWAWTETAGPKSDRRKWIPGGYDLEVGPVAAAPEENPKYLRWLKLEMPER